MLHPPELMCKSPDQGSVVHPVGIDSFFLVVGTDLNWDPPPIMIFCQFLARLFLY